MRSSCRRAGWPLERVLFALAGTTTLLSAALAALVSPWLLLLATFVGANQWLYVLSGACPASLALRRLFSLPLGTPHSADGALRARLGQSGAHHPRFRLPGLRRRGPGDQWDWYPL